MKRTARALGALVLLTTPSGVADSGAAEKYQSYYAALRARDSGDCDGVVRNLNAFLREYPFVQQKYPDFYLDVKYAIKACMDDGGHVRGVGESTEIEPLPDLPAMEE